jgi:hypothetical protein
VVIPVTINAPVQVDANVNIPVSIPINIDTRLGAIHATSQPQAR